MKKLLTSLVGVMSVVAVANAEPYVGLNFTYNRVGLDSLIGQIMGLRTEDIFEPHYFGGSIDVGYQFNDYLSIEGYFQYDPARKQDIDDPYSGEKFAESKMSFMSGGIDVLGYLPLNPCHSFNLIGSIGTGYYYLNQQLSGEFVDMMFDRDPSKFHENHLAARFGIGVQYNFNESTSVRAMGRYITWNRDSTNIFSVMGGSADLGDITRYMFEGSVGIQYKF